MTELQRLLDEDCDELARAMIGAAMDDGPPEGALQAAALALGVAPALTGAAILGVGSSSAFSASSSASAAAGAAGAAAVAPVGTVGLGSAGATLSALVVAKYVAVGMVTGLVAMGGLTLAERSRETPRSDAAAKVSSQGPRALTASGSAPLVARATTPALVNEDVAPASEPLEVAQKPAARKLAARTPSEIDAPAVAPAAVAAPANETASAAAFAEEPAKPAEPAQTVEQNKSLTRELALLDRARSALLSGKAGEALHLLDQYRRVRVSMILDPEAEALRILALDRQGQHETASRLAREFIAGHPASRQVDSLRALAESNR